MNIHIFAVENIFFQLTGKIAQMGDQMWDLGKYSLTCVYLKNIIYKNTPPFELY